MNEVQKHDVRRVRSGFFAKYCNGRGIDIGCGTTPFTNGAIGYDRMIDPSHDAEGPLPFADGHFDFVHSSHCLEHMRTPGDALAEWWRILKVGGHLIVLVPDFGLYEQRQWPSHYNGDHKSVWSLVKLVNAVSKLPNAEVIEARRNSDHYDFVDKTFDRTLGQAAADIEVVVLKYQSGWRFRSDTKALDAV
jgi:SAM-dependent methyltransferase